MENLDLQDPITGHLWKRSPSKLKLYRYQWRFVCLKSGMLYWWRNAEMYREKGFEGWSGCVDIHLNSCQVVKDGKHPHRFMMSAGEGKWQQGCFTGADGSRIFYFDASESERSREAWMSALKCHAKGVKPHRSEAAASVSTAEAPRPAEALAADLNVENQSSAEAAIAADLTVEEEAHETSDVVFSPPSRCVQVAASRACATSELQGRIRVALADAVASQSFRSVIDQVLDKSADKAQDATDARLGNGTLSVSAATRTPDDTLAAKSFDLDNGSSKSNVAVVSFATGDEVEEVPIDDGTASSGPETFCMQDSEPIVKRNEKRNSLEDRYNALEILAKATTRDQLHEEYLDVPASTEVYELFDDDLSSDDGGGAPRGPGPEEDDFMEADRRDAKRSTLTRHYDALDAGFALGSVAANETESFSEAHQLERETSSGSTAPERSDVVRRGFATPQSALQEWQARRRRSHSDLQSDANSASEMMRVSRGRAKGRAKTEGLPLANKPVEEEEELNTEYEY